MSRTIPTTELKILFARSGGICAFPRCGRALVETGSPTDVTVLVGHAAHIVADSRQGPRGRELLADADRSKHTNLLLLCLEHHTIVDARPQTYSVSVLKQMKLDHELLVAKALALPASVQPPVRGSEIVYSTLMQVTHLPEAVFSATCKLPTGSDEEIKRLITYPAARDELVPFVFRENKIFAFHDLRQTAGPFASIVDPNSSQVLRSVELWRDSEGKRRFVTLLNRSLYKYTARVRVRYDPKHYRFYFPPETLGSPRTVRHRTVSGRSSTRKVVWQPTKRSTGEPRNYWWHLAVALRFHHVGEMQWCLSLRPERHLTIDGETSLPSDIIGRRVTRLKARMYNDLYLGEITFWRNYLSKGGPRITLSFGNQSAVVEAAFIPLDMRWPGVPGDEKVVSGPATDDLFTLSDLEEIIRGDEIEWDEEDIGVEQVLDADDN